MSASRHVLFARRAYPFVFRGGLICVILAVGLRVAGLPIATGFGVAGLIAFGMGVVLAGIATSEPG